MGEAAPAENPTRPKGLKPEAWSLKPVRIGLGIDLNQSKLAFLSP